MEEEREEEAVVCEGMEENGVQMRRAGRVWAIMDYGRLRDTGTGRRMGMGGCTTHIPSSVL